MIEEKHRIELIELYPEMFDWSYKAPELNKWEGFYNRILSKLHKKFKFTRKFNPIKRPNPYNFSFGVGDGWYGLLKELIIGIREGDKKEKNGWVTKVTQCKEKFGGLRFYVTSTSKKNWDLIRKAEEKSYGVCEDTGSEVEVGTWNDGWVRTVCKKQALKLYGEYVKADVRRKGVAFDDVWKPKENQVVVVSNRKKKNGQKS